MLRFERIDELRDWLRSPGRKGRRIGFVPTMGALHEGHLSLVRACGELCDDVVVSIFVNPLQFGPSEDFDRYPRDVEADLSKLEAAGAGVVFSPDVPEMYPQVSGTSVHPGPAAERWEGALRPGHFAGVLTIVAKLFNIVEPDVALFGQKDYQQAVLVKWMVRDLNLAVRIEVLPTVRDHDGLALSSRNSYLSRDSRAAAASIPRALATMRRIWRAGERGSDVLLSAGRSVLHEGGVQSIDYLAVVHPDTLEPVSVAAPASVVLAAVRVGSTRLIDNTVLDDQPDTPLDRALIER
jgi:pantoate--beta-alanine ligase